MKKTDKSQPRSSRAKEDRIRKAGLFGRIKCDNREFLDLIKRQPAYLNIVLHEDGNYYLYTISRNITSYKKE